MTVTCNASAEGTVPETRLVATRGEDNFFNFDMTGDLDPGDLIWFRLADRQVDLTDTDAIFVKTRGAGIADVDAPNGIFQLQLEPADTANLLDYAYVFECIVRKVDVNMDTLLARGTLTLVGR